MSNFADRFRQEGLEQGVRQGMHQGTQQGEARMLLRKDHKPSALPALVDLAAVATVYKRRLRTVSLKLYRGRERRNPCATHF